MRHAAVAALGIIILFYEDIRRNFIPTFLSVLHTCASNKSRLFIWVEDSDTIGNHSQRKEVIPPTKRTFAKNVWIDSSVCLRAVSREIPTGNSREFPEKSCSRKFPGIISGSREFSGIFYVLRRGNVLNFTIFQMFFFWFRSSFTVEKKYHPCWKSLKFVNELHFSQNWGVFEFL